MDVRLIRRRLHRKQSGGLIALRFALVGLMAIFLSLATALLLGAGLLGGVYAFYAQGLPSADEIGRKSSESFETTRIYDRTGQHVLYEIIPPDGGRRTEVPLARIPENLRNGTIAMEDKTFYTNPVGINVEGVARAVWGELRGVNEGGGSSIPQQLIRNIIMSPEERMERSYTRKAKEMILAFEMTRQYPGVEGRDKILEWYLNNIFYGHLAYGVEAAAQTYFKKPVEDLTLAECAMLVPLGQSPALNPIDAPEAAKKRQELVLDAMYLQGYITAEDAYAAKQQALVIAPPSFDMVAPHYVLYVRQLLEQRYGSDAVYGGGLQVISAIDLDVQNRTLEIAREQIAEMRTTHNANNAAVVVLDTKSAEILAMVGSVDYADLSIDGQVNMAVSPRQPGSSFKPFVYATAFMQGYTPATMVMDVRTSFPDPPNAPYVPENYSRNYNGPLLLRRALACSYNIPAVAVADKVGIPNVLNTAHSMGINTLNNAYYGLAVALGGAEVTPLDMAYAFSVFANGGTMLGESVPAERLRPGYRQLDPVAILKVTSARGDVLYEYEEPQRRQVIRPEVAFLITDILSDNQARTPAFGAGSKMVLKDRPAAVKTGTTNDFFDAWTVGFTPQHVVAVWVGNTQYKEMKDADGSRVAAPIWQGVMEALHEDLPVESFQRPPDIETAVVDALSGKLPTDYSAARIQEIFIKGTVPTEHDDMHQLYRICRASGKLASPTCPLEEVEDKVFEVYPSGAEDWVRAREIPSPPRETCDIHGTNLVTQDVGIGSPKQLAPIRGIVPVMGSVKPGGLQRWNLQYGEGASPTEWIPIGSEYGHAVDNNLLEQWDTNGLNGYFTLQLTAYTDGGVQQSTVPVLVDNTPPTVTIISPLPDQRYQRDKDEWVNIQVDAQDNVSMQRVEFYVDDHLLGFSTVAPYTMRWNYRKPNPEGVEGPDGSQSVHTVYVIAFDSAGNETRSDTVTFRL
ncbi:MAG: transglycosylase domain-containing protein [Anaerolineae bacterium]